MSQVVREREVSGERVGEGVIEVQDLEQSVSLDDMQVTVGEGTHIRRALPYARLSPKLITENVAFTCKHNALM